MHVEGIIDESEELGTETFDDNADSTYEHRDGMF